MTVRTRRATSAALGAVTAALLALPLLLPSMAAADANPAAIVQSTSQSVVAILKNSRLDTDQKRTRIQDIVYQHFDFDTMARLMLARNWRRFTDAQRQEFIAQLKENLSLRYADRIGQYSGEKIQVIGTRPEPLGDVTVRTRVTGGKVKNVAVDYRMRHEDGSWRVIDVVIEGISLVSSYRDQFLEIVSSKGPERLLKLLKDKNAEARAQEIPAH